MSTSPLPSPVYSPPTVHCPHCFSEGPPVLHWVTTSMGRVFLRGDCTHCGRYVRWFTGAELTPVVLALAPRKPQESYKEAICPAKNTATLF
jgi:hypothetical protein